MSIPSALSRRLFGFLLLTALVTSWLGRGTVLAQEAPPPPVAEDPPEAEFDADPGAAARREANAAMLRAVDLLVRRHYYRAQSLDRLGWPDAVERFQDPILAADNDRALYLLLRELIASLESAHATIIAPDLYRVFWSDRRREDMPRLGFRMVKEAGGFFAMAITDGGAAEDAGLRLGDEILAINGVETERSPRVWEWANDHAIGRPLQYVALATDGEPVTVTFRREREGQARTVTLEPRSHGMDDATRASVRVVEQDGRRIGVIHLWTMGSRRITRILYDALGETFADVDALVVDLRGRGGLLDVTLRNFLPFGTAGPRDRPYRRRGEIPAWDDRPAVALVDEHARSAKEYFSYYWQREHVGPIVGRTTAGAGVSCNYYRLPDGAYLMLPIRPLTEYTDGTIIEMRGIAPDIAVEGRYPYAAGEDPILTVGLEIAWLLVNGEDTENPTTEINLPSSQYIDDAYSSRSAGSIGVAFPMAGGKTR